MKFHEMVFTIQVDHQMIDTLLDSIARSRYQDARKKLFVFKQLLSSHFLVEEFVLYPFIRKKMNNGERSALQKLFAPRDLDAGRAWLQEMEKQQTVCSDVVRLLSECMRAEESAFGGLFAEAAALTRERNLFEESWLLNGVDTSKTRLLRKADFVRLRIEE
ncbi:MAG: hypothetical protein HQL88_00360 [Magnetococcales bacterium]|nr:hypothetical protein [Magnetococcales bacterium]